MQSNKFEPYNLRDIMKAQPTKNEVIYTYSNNSLVFYIFIKWKMYLML